MKKLRYIYLGICLVFSLGILGQNFAVFAEEQGSDAVLSEGETSENLDEDSSENNGENSVENEVSSEILGLFRENEEGERISNVLIKSLNPGYGGQEIVGFFEIMKDPEVSNHSISLAGLTVIYERAGNSYTEFSFTEAHEFAGESLLLRQRSSEEAADATFPTAMAQGAGRLSLKLEDEVLDSVCWGDGYSGTFSERNGTTRVNFNDEAGCYRSFTYREPSVLVRNLEAEEVENLFQHLPATGEEAYIPAFDLENPGLLTHEISEETVEPKCRTVEFSELYTYFENVNTEQFIEFFNRSEERAEISGCLVRYKNHTYALSGEIPANGFLAVFPAEAWGLSLTKNPTSSNLLELIDVDGEVVDSLRYASGQKKGVSLAMIGFRSDGSENWVQTYNLTPGAENIYQQFRTCPLGKVINLETGNCVNETSLTSTLAACPEGKYRNPLTGRCKSYATTTSAELKPCAEGYERNPETGRCRKIVTNDGADYALETETFEEKSEFVAIWTIAIVILAGIVYIIFQYREEIRRKFSKK